MINITRPTMTLTLDGVEVSRHRSEVEAMESASDNGPGVYTLVRPDATITVSGVVVSDPDPEPEPQPDPDPDPLPVPSTGFGLRLVGGFRVPQTAIDRMNIFWGSGHIDFAHGKWLLTHPKGYLAQYTEPSQMGVGPVADWPMLEMSGDPIPAMESTADYRANAALYLDENTVLISSRKSYRSGFDPGWLGVVNLQEGTETLYTVKDPADTETDNFHVLQALGAGIIRLADSEWKSENLASHDFLIGRGGYDVLGSPLGPAFGTWTIGDPHAQFLVDFPSEFPARRDPHYAYPSKDPNTYDKAQLGIWKDPENGEGYWQAGDVGGIAYIPGVGFLASHNHARGLHDYRAQGDNGGNVGYFLVNDPATFYTENGTSGNRGDHQQETLNSTYPPGKLATTAHLIPESEVTAVINGDKLPHEVTMARFEWPRAGLEGFWDDTTNRATKVRGLVYRDGFVWAMMNFPNPIIACYEITDGSDNEPLNIPEGYGP